MTDVPSDRPPSLLKRLLILVPITLGAAVLAWQIGGRQAPDQAAPVEIARPVRVIEVRPTTWVPRALGYGQVQPGSIWEAVAQVGGKIVYRDPDLERGRLLEADKVILRIDPADYRLAITRIEANLSSVEAQLSELQIRARNTESSLEIERRALALASEDLERKRALLARGNTSQASVDQAESAVLAQQQRAQELENQLRLIPAERVVLEANAALRQAELEEAKLDLERTEIRMPFDGRVAEVPVEEAQFVNVGSRLAVVDSIDVAEIAAQFPIDRVAPLVRSDVDLSSMSAQQIAAVPRQFGLQARVRLASGSLEATWEARFDRLSEQIDPQTRTIGLIVAVDEPYRKAIPGRRPPLTKNMYVEVEVRGPAQPDRILVPRPAVHRADDGASLVYLAEGSRLAFRRVVTGVEQGDFVVVQEGLNGGENLVVSDLLPAIEGMLLDPAVDQALEERLAAAARGGPSGP